MNGDNALFAGESYVAVGRESTWGTGVTTTASIDFISSSIKVVKASQVLEEVSRKRTHQRDIRLGKVVAGDLMSNLYPDLTYTAYILQNAFGGAVTSATATAETTGGAAMTHTFNTGSFDQSYTALSMTERKGPAAGGKVFKYNGGRVNSLSLVANLDQAVQMTAGLVFKDATVGATDVESLLTTTALEPLTFVGARFSVESAMASLTSTSYWCMQSVNFNMNNNLKTDDQARCIGSDTLARLPYGIQSFELSGVMRFDTTTAYDAMMNSTSLCGELEFLGSTIPGSSVRRGLKLIFNKLKVNDAGDPEIGGPDETLESTVTFTVLRSESATGFAVKGELTNNISSLA